MDTIYDANINIILGFFASCFWSLLFAINVILAWISPVENQIDLELDFKVFFFVDSCCWGIVLDESNWCHSVIIERFEIFKMATKMAVS